MDTQDENGEESPLKAALRTVSRLIEEDLSAAHARFAERVAASPVNLHQQTFQYLIEYYDIHAHHHRFLVLSYQGTTGWYVPYLRDLIPKVMSKAEEITGGWRFPLNRDALLAALRPSLLGRFSHWKAEGLKRAREIESADSSVQDETPNPPIKAAKATASDERTRRGKLLDDYKAAAGNPSNKRIYEARNSGIHKPDFYAWLKGELPQESAMSINLERFLRLKQRPIPRQPKE